MKTTWLDKLNGEIMGAPFSGCETVKQAKSLQINNLRRQDTQKHSPCDPETVSPVQPHLCTFVFPPQLG